MFCFVLCLKELSYSELCNIFLHVQSFVLWYKHISFDVLARKIKENSVPRTAKWSWGYCWCFTYFDTACLGRFTTSFSSCWWLILSRDFEMVKLGCHLGLDVGFPVIIVLVWVPEEAITGVKSTGQTNVLQFV